MEQCERVNWNQSPASELPATHCDCARSLLIFDSPRRAGETGEKLVEADGEGAALGVGLRGDGVAVTQAIEDGGAFDEAARGDCVEVLLVVLREAPGAFRDVQHHAVRGAE